MTLLSMVMSLKFPISLLASHVAFCVEIMLYLCEELKDVFQVGDK